LTRIKAGRQRAPFPIARVHARFDGINAAIS
jgi:hypothetical protein